MHISHPRAGRSLPFLVLALIVVALVGAACVPAASSTAVPTAAATTAPATAAPVQATSAPATSAPVAAATAAVTAAVTAVPTVDMSQVATGVDADGHFYRGDLKASVKLVEFSDFQCPYCSRHTNVTGPLLDKAYVVTNQVLHVFRNFPLDFHPNAMPAAKAAYCAGQQKPALFWTMHDWLFTNQDKWSSAQDASPQFREQAVAAGADGTKFDACVKASETEAAIQSDQQEGLTMGVQGTPAFFINDWFLNGAQPIEQFKTAIEKAQKGLHPAPTATPLPEGVAPYDSNPARPGFTYDGSPELGKSDAKLVLIAFADFKCTYCGQFNTETEPTLRKKYVDPGQMRMIFKFYPIEAPKSAVAAMCAAGQGKFWEFHDALFAHQSEWQDGNDSQMVAYAKTLGLDEAKFQKCLSEAPDQPTIDADTELGQQLGIQGTPYFLLLNVAQNSGVRVPGALPLDQFEKAIEQVLNPVTVTPTPSTSN